MTRKMGLSPPFLEKCATFDFIYSLRDEQTEIRAPDRDDFCASCRRGACSSYSGQETRGKQSFTSRNRVYSGGMR